MFYILNFRRSQFELILVIMLLMDGYFQVQLFYGCLEVGGWMGNFWENYVFLFY